MVILLSFTQLGQWSSYYHLHSWGNGHPNIQVPFAQLGQWSSYYRVPSTQLGQWSSFFYTSSIHTVGPMVILLYNFQSHSWGNGHPTIIHTVGAMVILIYKFHPHSWVNGYPTTKVPSIQLWQWSS